MTGIVLHIYNNGLKKTWQYKTWDGTEQLGLKNIIAGIIKQYSYFGKQFCGFL